ncbi:hypothetical protein [Halomarina pelagica]|uniref:hypothetical protein n=1 Tax=Halomarina pelagica TaxID=2961599 RepID=UPI0020C484E0|nr:hypothetical protein [Halomarina sp. BND7]
MPLYEAADGTRVTGSEICDAHLAGELPLREVRVVEDGVVVRGTHYRRVPDESA